MRKHFNHTTHQLICADKSLHNQYHIASDNSDLWLNMCTIDEDRDSQWVTIIEPFQITMKAFPIFLKDSQVNNLEPTATHAFWQIQRYYEEITSVS